MPEIIPVNYRDDILPEYRGTPVEALLECPGPLWLAAWLGNVKPRHA